MITKRLKIKAPAGPLKTISYGRVDGKRFEIVVSGRRIGKSEQAALRLIRETILCPNPTWENWYVGFTRVAARRIMWERIKSLIPREIIKGKPNESRLEITLINNNRLCLQGADDPNGLVGSAINFLVMDEYAKMKPTVWQYLKPALADTKGRGIFIGTPLGFNHFKDLYEMGLEGNNDYFSYPIFTTSQSPWVSKEEIEEARRTMDPLFFRQEFEGSFENYRGLVYSDFADRDHFNGGSLMQREFDPNLETYCGLDFGFVHDMAIIWMQYDRMNDIWYILKDALIKSHLTPHEIATILNEGELVSFDKGFTYVAPVPKQYLPEVNFISGVEALQRRQESGGTSMKQVLKRYGVKNLRIISHRIFPSVMTLRGYIMNDLGLRRFFVDPRGNKRLRADFLQYHYPEKDGIISSEIPLKDDKSDHSMDAIRYVVDTVTPSKYARDYGSL